jgi:hypothetical protein
MTIDKELPLVIGAVCTGIGLLATTATTIYLQVKAAKRAEAAATLAAANKTEAIAARASLESKVDTVVGHVTDIAAAVTTPPTGGTS